MRDFLDGILRQTLAHPARSLFLILALAIGALSFSVGMGLSSRLGALRGEFSGASTRFTIAGGSLDTAGQFSWKMPPEFSADVMARLKAEIPQITSLSQVDDVRWFQVQVGEDRYSIRSVLGVGNEYPAVMGLRLKAGRFFTAGEESSAQKVAVISESLASIMFGGDQQALGGTIQTNNAVFLRGPGQGNRTAASSTSSSGSSTGSSASSSRASSTAPRDARMETQVFTVVGVYADPTEFLMNAYGAPDAIVPSTASSFSFGPFAGAFRSLQGRTDGLGSEGLRTKVSRSLESLGASDPQVLVWEGSPDNPNDKTAQQTKQAMLLFSTVLTALAFIILALSAVGVFSSVNTEVADASKSICVRRALGADRGTIARAYLSKGLAFGLVGGFLGALGAYPAYALVARAATLAMDRLGLAGLSLGSLGFGWVLLGIAATAAMSVLFSLLPALRASRLSIVEGIKEL